MPDTVPTDPADPLHPSWCDPAQCGVGATPGFVGSHASRDLILQHRDGGRTVVFISAVASEPQRWTLTIERWFCPCETCEPHEVLMYDASHARQLHGVLGDLLDLADGHWSTAGAASNG